MTVYTGSITVDGNVQLVKRVLKSVPASQRPIYWGFTISGLSGLSLPQKLGDAWVCRSDSSTGTPVFHSEGVVAAYRSVWTTGIWVDLSSILYGREATNLWFRGRKAVVGKTLSWFYGDNVG